MLFFLAIKIVQTSHLTLFTEPIKADLAKLKENMKKIEQRVIELKDIGVRCRCKGKISGLDGKLIGWVTNTKSMRRCNLCKLLPREYRFKVEYLFDELSMEAIENIAAAILHFGKQSNLYFRLQSDLYFIQGPTVQNHC